MNLIYLALTRMYEWGNRLMWALALLSVPFWLYVVVYTVPEAQTIAQQQQQDALWRENHFFCAKHGMPSGTREHAQCVEDLTKIRGREAQRVAAETADLF
ncbi:MAG TPA: hypothetical protein VE993_00960 [Stellaceae bacterium]|nr:hypothetical protein [Stellaceae bacterium]